MTTSLPADLAGRSQFDQLVYRLSHDLQAPMRALTLISDWVREDLEAEGVALPPVVDGHLKMMAAQSARLAQLVTGLLTYSRVGRPQPMISGTWEDLLARTAKGIEKASLFDIRLDVEGRLHGIGAADAQALLHALISNAVKHHDRSVGIVEVRGRVLEEQIEITVTDDGPGLAERDWERAKSPMVTLRSRDDVEGSGMGLSIAEKIAAHYGGSLEILPTPGKRGCTIRATLGRRDSL